MICGYNVFYADDGDKSCHDGKHGVVFLWYYNIIIVFYLSYKFTVLIDYNTGSVYNTMVIWRFVTMLVSIMESDCMFFIS